MVQALHLPMARAKKSPTFKGNHFMKVLVLLLSTLVMSQAFAGNLTLNGGESVVIQANTSTRVTCNATAGGGGSSPDLAQCHYDNANLQNQVNQLQNQLYQCQNSQRPQVWNCTYTCGGNNGMGSDANKAVACRAAKSDSGVQCSSQCDCTLE